MEERETMTLKKAYPVLAIVLGAVGGVLHGLDLVQGYDSADLPTGAPWLTMLYVLSAIAVVLCVLRTSHNANKRLMTNQKIFLSLSFIITNPHRKLKVFRQGYWRAMRL